MPPVTIPVALDEQVRSRRLKSVSVILVAAIVLLPSMVVLIPLAVIVDLVRLKLRLPLARVLLFGCVYLLWEVWAVANGLFMWLATGFGRGLGSERSVDYHRRLQLHWATGLMRTIERVLGLRIEATGQECAIPAGCVLISRHASLIDTLVPIRLLGPSGMNFRYILKTELLVDPAIDIIAHRFPNYFVDRSGTDSARELEQIAALAAGTRPDEVFVIFPEGSRYTPAKKARAMEKLSVSNPGLAELAEGFTATMPPRPGGTLAAINALPDGDVIVLAHTGLEGLAGVKEVVSSVPLRHPLRVGMWRIARADIPTDPEEQQRWLFRTWQDVDDWVVANRS